MSVASDHRPSAQPAAAEATSDPAASEAAATERLVVALRPAVDADAPFLLLVYAGTREEELAQVPWSDEQKLAFVRMQFEAQDAHYREHYPQSERFVIEVGGEPAGRLYVDRHGREEVRIMDIALLAPFRGQGVGGRLLEALVHEGQATGRAVRIHVEKHNRALGLYERLGFRAIADRGVYWFLERLPG